MPELTFFYLLLLLLAAFCGGLAMRVLKQPPIIGYLLAGLTLGILFGDSLTHTSVSFLSELGIILLLFTLGLEFSWGRIQKVARIAIFGGLAQIFFSTVLTGSIISLFGFDLFSSFFMAAAFSLSSTAVVVKLLTDRGELDTLPGEIMVGWLVVQDLAVVPMLVLFPFLHAVDGNEILPAIYGIVISLFVLGAILIIGKKLIPTLVSAMSLLGSRELLLVGVFAIAIGTAILTQAFGMSLAIGAFLAGVLISESIEQHAVLSEIRPLRDVFSLLFFTSMGLLMPSGFLYSHFLEVIFITILVVLIKFILVGSITLIFKQHPKTSFIIGIGLIEVGEFAFILANLGLSQKLINIDTYALILSVSLLSIVLMPPLFMMAPKLFEILRLLVKKRYPGLYVTFFNTFEHTLISRYFDLKNHVIICGFGRVGKYIGKALHMAHIPYLVVDYNHHTVKVLQSEGIPVIFGDGADLDILEAACIDTARAVVIAIPDLHTQMQIIGNSKNVNPDIQIYCRSHHEEHQEHLKFLGVHEVIQPEFEAAITLTGKLYDLFNQSKAELRTSLSVLTNEHLGNNFQN